MKTIFVMVKCALGKLYAVADEIVSVDEVSEVWAISGKYDILLKINLADTDDLGHFIMERLQSISGIKDTFTIITFRAFSED